MNITEYIKEILESGTARDVYSVAITIIALFFIFKSMYLKIKYICLEQASEKIATVEELENLTGEEKFALVLCWINTDLPKIFNNAKMQAVIESIIDFVYNNAFKYAQNYIKRKTGYDVKELVDTIKAADEDAKSEASTKEDEKSE